MRSVLSLPARLWSKLANQGAIIGQLGVVNWFRFKLLPLLPVPSGGRGMGSLTVPGTDHPIYFRNRSSDRFVCHQIFIEREYACLDDLTHPGLILDCGANVGYSSAYFLSRFPDCSVIAVEPDPGNFEVLELNLAPFGSRARTVRAAIWSHPTGLKISESKYRDGREWSCQVAECGPEEDPTVIAVDIPTLLRDSGRERISLLKMDIEGAEAVVFSRGYESWIDLVDNIAIELHYDSPFGDAPRAFHDAIAGRGFATSRSGELTICRRPAG
ncbi:MAG: FkbM family methyltransferase [Isosphaeraceae bacterium]